MGTHTHKQLTPGSSSPAEKPVKLEAKARRKPAARPKRAKSSGGGKGPNVWLPLLGVATLSAAGGYYFHDPAKAQKDLAGFGERITAAGNAFAGTEDQPKRSQTPREAKKAEPKAETAKLLANAPKALPATPLEKDATPAPAKPAAGTTPATAAPKPLWAAPEEKQLNEALAKRDMEDFRELLAKHRNILPIEAGVEQDLLATSIARRKIADAEFIMSSGISPDRVLTTPIKSEFLQLVGNPTFTKAAATDKNITLLMVAAATGDAKMVEHLQNRGARNRSTSVNKYTALDFAVAANKPEAIQACVGRKAGDESSRIVVSLKERTATFIQDGRIRERSWISSGRSGHPTPVGRFVVTQKHKDWTSTKYHVKMPYFLRLNNGAIGLHAGNVPPYPASHGCIRLPDAHAKTFFQMADVGTIVDIVN